MTMQIGLWGGARSGKTTFLAALRVATLRSADGSWRLAGLDPISSSFLNDQTNLLISAKEFPPASLQGGTEYHIFMSGDRHVGLFDMIGSWLGRPTPTTDGFTLNLVDHPGVFYEDTKAIRQLADSVAILGKSDGMVFFFDPTVDPAKDTNDRNFRAQQAVLDGLYSAAAAANKLIDGRLQQHLAVCVTKIDEQTVFKRLRDAGAVTVEQLTDDQHSDDQHSDDQHSDDQHSDDQHSDDQHSDDQHSDDQHRIVGLDGDLAFKTLAPDLIQRSIGNYFIPARVAYFATSAIGFYSPDGDSVRLEDCSNTTTRDGRGYLRDDPRPFNVLEPLLWLRQSIGSAGRG